MKTTIAIICAALLTGCMQSAGGYHPSTYELQRRQMIYDMGMQMMMRGIYGNPQARRAYVGQALRY